MKNLNLVAVVMVAIFLTACSKEFTKKHEARFKVNGTEYNCGEDGVSASYYNGTSNLLQVAAIAGTSGSYGSMILIDLNKIDQTVSIDSAQDGFSYLGSTSIYYLPVSGEWKITSHKEGNPASRHTEGTFAFTAVNPYTITDTVRITEGYFYVNNY